MLSFPYNLPIPTPYYECSNILDCPDGTYRTADAFSWWDPSSLVYKPTRDMILIPTHQAPWQHQILYPVNTIKPPAGWWCNPCIESLESFATHPIAPYSRTPMEAWLYRPNQENFLGQSDLILTSIKDPLSSYQCGHIQCPHYIPPDELSYCQVVYPDSQPEDAHNQTELRHKWLCVNHTDDFYAQLQHNLTLTVQIGPNLQGLLNLNLSTSKLNPPSVSRPDVPQKRTQQHR